MHMDRRALFGALGLAVAGGVAGAAAAQDQNRVAAAPPSAADRIGAAAAEHRQILGFDGARFSGEAWESLQREGNHAHYFLIGEEHGIAENPKLAAALFAALAPGGYSKACIEISPPMAAELERAIDAGGLEGLRRLFADEGARPAFFAMREEAEWLVAARAAAPRGAALWGLDYEVGADRRLVALLKAKRKPAAAVAALDALEEAQRASWARHSETRGPQHIFSFAGDPALVQAVRAAWRNPDAEADWMLETLEETLLINQHWVQGRPWQSNDRRSRFNRRNLRRYMAAERGAGPKVMFKFGASHMVRGLTHAQTHDIGTQIAEMAEARGVGVFSLLVLPGAGTQHARFDPAAYTYRASPTGAGYEQALAPLLGAAHGDAFTLIDLRPLRALAYGSRLETLHRDLVRTVHGFDMALVMSGSTASANL